jgi:hypothetical protein
MLASAGLLARARKFGRADSEVCLEVGLDVGPLEVNGVAALNVRDDSVALPVFDRAHGFAEPCREGFLGDEPFGSARRSAGSDLLRGARRVHLGCRLQFHTSLLFLLRSVRNQPGAGHAHVTHIHPVFCMESGSGNSFRLLSLPFGSFRPLSLPFAKKHSHFPLTDFQKSDRFDVEAGGTPFRSAPSVPGGASILRTMLAGGVGNLRGDPRRKFQEKVPEIQEVTESDTGTAEMQS